jgi:hypothetical protein
VGLEQATTLAIRALAFLAAEDAALGRFLGTTGLDLAELRELPDDPTLLGAVLDYLLSDEPLLLRFCAENDVPPEWPARARAKLPGFLPRD